MTLVRVLRSALIACWSACRSTIDVWDLVALVGLSVLTVGLGQIYAPLHWITPGSYLLFIANFPSRPQRRVKRPPAEVRR